MKAAGAFNDRPRELHHNMQQTYCENRNGATLRNVISAPRTPSTPWSKRGCLGWVGFSPSPGPFLYWIGLKNWGHRTGSGRTERLPCHPRSRRFEGRSHTMKFFLTPRQGHPSGYLMTLHFCWERLAGIYQHTFEPNVAPSNFFGLRHGTSPRSHYQVRG
jgi:hypothetical protein